MADCSPGVSGAALQAAVAAPGQSEGYATQAPTGEQWFRRYDVAAFEFLI